MQPNGIDPSDDVGMAPKSPFSEMMTREAKAIMDGEAPPLVNPIMAPPAYKTVELRFGDAAITLRGDGGLDGDLAAFTAALKTINPAADDVAFAVGWLVANCQELRRTVTTQQVFSHADHLSERATHEAAQARVARDYND